MKEAIVANGGGNLSPLTVQLCSSICQVWLCQRHCWSSLNKRQGASPISSGIRLSVWLVCISTRIVRAMVVALSRRTSSIVLVNVFVRTVRTKFRKLWIDIEQEEWLGAICYSQITATMLYKKVRPLHYILLRSKLWEPKQNIHRGVFFLCNQERKTKFVEQCYPSSNHRGFLQRPVIVCSSCIKVKIVKTVTKCEKSSQTILWALLHALNCYPDPSINHLMPLVLVPPSYWGWQWHHWSLSAGLI